MELPSASDILKMISKPRFVTESKPELWHGYVEPEEMDRKETEEYIRKRDLEDNIPNPEVAYLNKTIFPLLRPALIEMLQKVKDENSFFHDKSTFNGLDYLSEVLYNRNPKYKEREANWTYIFDMQWVQNFLEQNPRPRYPFNLIWRDELAALKIQSFMRGYWVRNRPEVQELRLFWRTLKNESFTNLP